MWTDPSQPDQAALAQAAEALGTATRARQVLAVVASEQRARELVVRTLGTLAGADPELRDTLCVYIGEQFSAARAARALYTHRNTVLNRLQRAERLLPLPLAGHGLEIGVALEIAQWL